MEYTKEEREALQRVSKELENALVEIRNKVQKLIDEAEKQIKEVK